MKIIFNLLILFSLVNFINSQSTTQPTILKLEGTIYDQYPYFDNNFEPIAGSLTTRLVQNAINTTTRTPTLNTLLPFTSTNVQGRMVVPSLFQYFYQPNKNAPLTNNSGANFPIPMTVNLTLNPSTGTYVYDNQFFFPIDYQGFDQDPFYRNYTDGTDYHNFHFCLKINTRFTYTGNEVFYFIGDDDVWVFINDQLVIDLGGLHEAAGKNVDLTTLGLIKNKDYTFDFFYCERHTTKSTIRIETSIQAYCPFYDYCGVCYGDGSTCCDPKVNCNDGDSCTIDSCPPRDTIIPAGFSISDLCQHTPVLCPSIDMCTNNTCDSKSGQCAPTSIKCDDKSSQCLTLKPCDPSSGCLYTSSCTSAHNPCYTGTCSNGQCQTKSNSTCAAELGNDPCKVYYCNINSGCVSQPLCKQGPDSCEQNICNAGVCTIKKLDPSVCSCGCVLNKCQKNNCVAASNGTSVCSPLPLDEIDDGNPCTDDHCDEATGLISHNLTTKCTGCMKCNATTGSCSPTNNECQDGNECTDNICVAADSNINQGECSNKTVSCPTTDKCLVYTCDTNKGCVSKPVVCPNSGNCQVGVCDSVKGCKLVPRVCNSTAFCLVSQCDEAIGCITFEKRCSPDNSKCQSGVCVNATATEPGKCKSVDYDPKPFICQTGAIVSTAVVASVVVVGAVVLGAAIFAGKKGYDHWKSNQGQVFASSNANPLYQQSNNGGENALFEAPQ
ncbi:hypothetical protein ACTFIY_001929 [Dictyostelium cf. discoideum]